MFSSPRPTVLTLPLLLAALLAVGACSDDTPTGPEAVPPALLSVIPHDGATGVDPMGEVVMEFDHPLMPGMEALADLHEGDLTGPEVPGDWRMSADGTRLVFSPEQPLAPLTEHTVHIGGGMMGLNGLPLDLEHHGPAMGGEWATQGMMGGGSQGGMGGGMGQGTGAHMGDGWQHPDNGSYGMIFTFTTGG